MIRDFLISIDIDLQNFLYHLISAILLRTRQFKSEANKPFFNFHAITIETVQQKRKDRLLALDSCLSGGEKRCR
jgi:hypothetical protein